jgi:hypothetical protein
VTQSPTHSCAWPDPSSCRSWRVVVVPLLVTKRTIPFSPIAPLCVMDRKRRYGTVVVWMQYYSGFCLDDTVDRTTFWSSFLEDAFDAHARHGIGPCMRMYVGRGPVSNKRSSLNQTTSCTDGTRSIDPSMDRINAYHPRSCIAYGPATRARAPAPALHLPRRAYVRAFIACFASPIGPLNCSNAPL